MYVAVAPLVVGTASDVGLIAVIVGPVTVNNAVLVTVPPSAFVTVTVYVPAVAPASEALKVNVPVFTQATFETVGFDPSTVLVNVTDGTAVVDVLFSKPEPEIVNDGLEFSIADAGDTAVTVGAVVNNSASANALDVPLVSDTDTEKLPAAAAAPSVNVARTVVPVSETLENVVPGAVEATEAPELLDSLAKPLPVRTISPVLPELAPTVELLV